MSTRAATLRASIDIQVTEVLSGIGVNSSLAQLLHRFLKQIDVGSGTSDGLQDRVWSGTGTATTTPASIDAVGSLTSALAGSTTSLAELTWLIFENTGATSILLGGGATPLAGLLTTGTSDSIPVPAGSFIIKYLGDAGVAVTGGSTDLLWVTAASGTPTYNAILVGRSS